MRAHFFRSLTERGIVPCGDGRANTERAFTSPVALQPFTYRECGEAAGERVELISVYAARLLRKTH